MTSADDAVREVLEDLSSDDPRERVIMLDVLSERPMDSPAVLSRIRELMADETPAILALPFLFGEVRYMAARALVAAHVRAAIAEPVVLADVPSLLDTNDIGTLSRQAGLPSMKPLAAYAELRRRGLIPLTTVRLDPARWPPFSPTSTRLGGEPGQDVVGEALQDLADEDPGARSGTLQHLSRYPSGSPEVAAVVRELLSDTSPAYVDLPSVYGEVRWAAAHALAAELETRGVVEPVVLADVPAPLSDQEMAPLAKTAGLENLSRAELYGALRDRGLVPRTTLTLTEAQTAAGRPDVALVELLGRVLDFADRARRSMCAEFGVRYISEVAMLARLRRIERNGTSADGVRYFIHGNGYDVYATEAAALTMQGEGYANVDRPAGQDANVYDYVDLYALRDFLRRWVDTLVDLDELTKACAEHCRRGTLRDAGHLTYELLRAPGLPPVPGGVEEDQ